MFGSNTEIKLSFAYFNTMQLLIFQTFRIIMCRKMAFQGDNRLYLTLK
jgi:hypothetical protein